MDSEPFRLLIIPMNFKVYHGAVDASHQSHNTPLQLCQKNRSFWEYLSVISYTRVGTACIWRKYVVKRYTEVKRIVSCSIMPWLFSRIFAILLFGGFGIICAVMTFFFAVTYIVKQIGLLLNFSELSIHVCTAVSCLFSWSFDFHLYCEWGYKLNQKL